MWAVAWARVSGRARTVGDGLRSEIAFPGRARGPRVAARRVRRNVEEEQRLAPRRQRQRHPAVAVGVAAAAALGRELSPRAHDRRELRLRAAAAEEAGARRGERDHHHLVLHPRVEEVRLRLTLGVESVEPARLDAERDVVAEDAGPPAGSVAAHRRRQLQRVGRGGRVAPGQLEPDGPPIELVRRGGGDAFEVRPPPHRAREAGAPAEAAREVVARAERHRREREVAPDVLHRRHQPAAGAVAWIAGGRWARRAVGWATLGGNQSAAAASPRHPRGEGAPPGGRGQPRANGSACKEVRGCAGSGKLGHFEHAAPPPHTSTRSPSTEAKRRSASSGLVVARSITCAGGGGAGCGSGAGLLAAGRERTLEPEGDTCSGRSHELNCASRGLPCWPPERELTNTSSGIFEPSIIFSSPETAGSASAVGVPPRSSTLESTAEAASGRLCSWAVVSETTAAGAGAGMRLAPVCARRLPDAACPTPNKHAGDDTQRTALAQR